MIKKFLLIVSLLVFTTATNYAEQSYTETHTYVGLFGGPIIWNNSQQLSVMQKWGPFTGQTFNLPSSKYTKTGFSGGGVFGLRHIFINNITLAGELDLDYDVVVCKKTKKSGDDTNSHVIKQKLGQTVGVSLMPGYQFTQNLMAFLKFGYNINQFKIINGNAGNFGPSGNHSKWISAISYGAAIEYSLTHHWHLRGEYDFIDYSNSNITGISYPINTPGAAAGPVTSKNNIYSNKILLMLIYQM